MILSHKLFPALMLCLYAAMSLSSMAGMNISFLCVACAFVYGIMSNRFSIPAELKSSSDFRHYLIFGGALFAACLLSLIVAKIFPVTYAGHVPEITVHGFLKIWYLFCPLIIASVFLQLKDLQTWMNRVKHVWWLATLALAAIALIQFSTGWPIAQPIPTNPDHYHAVLFFGHHLSTASIIIFPTFVAIAETIGYGLREKRLAKLAACTSLAGFLILFLSYARTAWLSVPIGLLVLFFRYLKPKTRWICVAGLGITLILGSQTDLMKKRILNSMGIEERIELWVANIDFFKHNPITGIGWLKTQEMSEFYFKQKFPDTYRSHFWGHAHSNFFEMLGGTGICGLLAFLVWSGFTLKLAYDAATFPTSPISRASASACISSEPESEPSSLNDFACGLGVALILLHINGLTNVTFWEGKVMHQQMFAVAWLLVIRVMQKRHLASSISASPRMRT